MQIAALVLLGVITFTRLPVDLLPKVSLPTISVSTSWPNVAPEEMEVQVTRPIEQALSSVPGLYQIKSSTETGNSSVRVTFQWGTDIGRAAVDALQLVERAKRTFPNDPTLGNPMVFKFDPTQTPILVFGVSGEDDPVKLRTMLDNQVSPILESADGVASATVTGGQQRAIIVDVDPIKLSAHHLALADVMRRLVEENINLPAGIARQSETEYTVRSLGWLTSPQEIAQVPLGSFNGQLITLSDVAAVRDEHTETRVFTRLNKRPAAGLTITKQSGANTVTTANAVEQRLEQVKKMYPQLKFDIAYDQSAYIQNSINDLRTSAIIGAVLAILILLFFLRNIRSTLVVALSIPISIISTFTLLFLCGSSLNTMSLGGLALATGLIVDDAVVVLENIFRHIERDKESATEAAIKGTNEIITAVVASTWTVMVVFLPLLLIKGQAGQMFTQFALVVIFALAVSLLVAATVVPMLATRLISGEAHAEMLASGHQGNFTMRMFARFGRWFNGLDATYRNGLRWALHYRWLTLGCALTVTLASLLLLPQIGRELMPQTDSGDLSVSVKMPPGTALGKTNATMQKIEAILLSDSDVGTVFATAGASGGMRGGGNPVSSEGSVTVKLKEGHKKSTQEVIAALRKQFVALPGVRPRINQNDLVTMLMTGGNQNVEVDIFGDDLATLSTSAREVIRRLNGISSLENIDMNWQEAMPEVQWKVDRQRAAQLGVSFKDISDTVETATSGSLASYYQEKGFQYPIIVQLPLAARKTVEKMGNMVLRSSSPAQGGREVILSQVVHPVYALGPSEITRQDRQRYIAVSGTPQGRSAGDIQADVQRALADFHLPQGFYWDWGTNQKRQAEEFSGMGLAIILAIGLIYMLLAAQFESFIHPLVILFSVPLAATGVILALFLTGRSLGLTAFIGVLMLVGIVVKNSILLVDYTNVLRKRGLERNEAVLTASPTRLRPILMTASATMLGMLPLALALGKGSEIQAPMATAVIGGLATSTFLTLFVVPTVYTLFDDIALRLRRKGAGQ
jgi:HAE1 family hydrophobic/amphiphilic exporter-1